MTVQELATALGAEVLAGNDGLEKKVLGGYAGDLLSWVMGRAREGDAWVTVMGNVNAIAVAVLADIACVILADSSALDDNAAERANMQGVPVLRSSDDIFTLCNRIATLL